MAEITATTTPGIGKLAWIDGLKGGIVAAISAALTTIYQAISDGSFDKINWKVVGLAALGMFISYLLKNIFTPSQTIISPPPGAGQVMVNIPAKGQSADTSVKKTQ